jgi:hypothetical protein
MHGIISLERHDSPLPAVLSWDSFVAKMLSTRDRSDVVSPVVFAVFGKEVRCTHASACTARCSAAPHLDAGFLEVGFSRTASEQQAIDVSSSDHLACRREP